VFSRSIAIGVLAGFLLALAGCDSTPKPIAAKGMVTYKGEPLAGASVGFVPVSQTGQMASGTTNAGGEFTLTTAGNPGAMPGEYQVAVSKVGATFNQPSGDPAELAKAKVNMPTGGASARPKSAIPVKYADPKQGGLKATVTADPAKNTFDFPLSD
jgi:hypothetical protein